jgi:hypothetical protein
MSIKSKENLEKLQKNFSELSGTTELMLVDIMDSQFIAGCSQYSSLEELFDSSGFKIDSKEDFEAIPDDEWEAFITSNTSYDSWLEMQKAAVTAYTQKKLFSGLK